MPQHCITFEPIDRRTMKLPSDKLEAGRYVVQVEQGGSVTVLGNRDGLLYLAEVIVQCALGEYERGFHVHLPLSSNVHGPNIDMQPELTIYAADESQ